MYWAILGTLYLLRLTYQDYKNNMLIDDRYNWFMYGITFSLIPYLKIGFVYSVALIIIVLFLRYWIIKFKVVAEGDANSFLWIFYGFGLISITAFISYSIIIIFMYLLFFGLRKFYLKGYKGAIPFFIVILLSFILNCAILNIYGF